MRYCLFDLDGTLVDSYGVDTKSFIQAVADVLQVDIDGQWDRYPHVSDEGIVNVLLQDLNERERTKMTAKIKSRFLERLANNTKVSPIQPIKGARQFLLYLRKKGVPIAIATGAWRESADFKLEQAGLLDLRLPMVTSSEYFARESIMQSALEILAEFASLNARNIYYFGDGPWDKIASANLGMEFIAIGDRVCGAHNLPDFAHAASLRWATDFLYSEDFT